MKLLARMSLGVFVFVVVYFGYLGVTTAPSELDSILYHIPIAESVVKGTVWKPEFENPYSYYPGTGETILAIFGFLQLPLNLYNVLGLVLFFWVTKILTVRVGLTGDEATIMGVSMALLPTVIRLPLTQLVDIWLAVFWGWWLYLAEKPETSKKWQILLGIASGLLIGTKISGIMLLGTGLLIYGNSFKRWGFLVVTGIVGGFWYLRNWVVMGNPFYPLGFWIWKGHEAAILPIVWKFLWFENGWGRTVQALVSEFLGWVGAFVTMVFFRNKWILLGTINAILFLIMPGSPGTIVSNCRYLIPAVMTLVLGVWLELKKRGWGEMMAVLAVMNSVMVLPQLDYRPKIVIVSLLIIACHREAMKWLWRSKNKRLLRFTRNDNI